MARKPRTPKKRIEGTWQVDTAIARVVAAPERDGAYILELNNVPSSYVVLGAPRVLGFQYMEIIAAVLRTLDLDQAHVLHLGGAAHSLPRFITDVWPGSHNTVIEIDGGLAELVRELFDIPDEVATIVAEARTATHRLPPGSVEVLIRDVFAGPDTPRHLTTVEYFAACRRILGPRGLFIANSGDEQGLPGTRAELAGLAEVFAHVAALGPPEMLAGRAYGNVVLLASDSPLPELGAAELGEAKLPAGIVSRDVSDMPVGKPRRDSDSSSGEGNEGS